MATSPFKSLINETVRVKVVDVGANPIDSAPPYSDLLSAGDADVVGFEPNRDALAKLHTLKGPNETYLPYALGDGGRHTLHMCAAPGMTSLLTPNPQVLNLFHGFPEWGRVVATEEVDTVRMDDIAETAGVDLIKIDIQGAELMVFRNATDRLADALVIHTEVEFLPMYVGQPLFSDVEIFLRQHGFVFHRFFPLTSRVIQPLLIGNDIYAGLSQSVWADAIFVRDFTRLALLPNDRLLAMAAILHDCYESIDLVHHLLVECDKRTGKQRAPTYLANLRASAQVPEVKPT
jgi:FkbM family methyltransferase